MIDTVKIAVPYRKRPVWLDRVDRDSKRNANNGFFTATIYPSNSYKRSGIYLPTLRYAERPATRTQDRSYELNIELSLPKLYYGNNFNELTDDLFSAVLAKLSRLLRTVYGIRIKPSTLERALVGRIDYSKNIIFTDRTPVSTIISTLEKAEIPKTYDVQKTNFRNGGLIYHAKHTNTIDVVLYDKIADLRQGKVSDKRTREDDNYSQLNLIAEFDKHPNVTIPRWEIRLSTRRKIRKELEAVGVGNDLHFSHLFSTDISRKILLQHWEKILDLIPSTEIPADTVTQILVGYKQTYPDMKFSRAGALTLMQLLRNEQGERAVRNTIEGLFGLEQYNRLKKMTRNSIKKTESKDLRHITETLTAMTPVSIADFI